jgi:hypothetical protein
MKYIVGYYIYIIPLLKNKMKIQNFVSETIIVQKTCAIYTNVKHHYVVSETIILQNMPHEKACCKTIVSLTKAIHTQVKNHSVVSETIILQNYTRIYISCCCMMLHLI